MAAQPATPLSPPTHPQPPIAPGGGATPACVAGLALLTAKNSTQEALLLGFNAYLAEHGQPVDGSGQLAEQDLLCVLEVRQTSERAALLGRLPSAASRGQGRGRAGRRQRCST